LSQKSIGWIEAYIVLKRLGCGVTLDAAAKDVDAFLLLEDLIAMERSAVVADRVQNKELTKSRER
jgi:hypothetical protein